MTARELIQHCRAKARKLAATEVEHLQYRDPDLPIDEAWKQVDALRREAAELNRAANEAEGRLGGYPFDGRDPGALRLIEMEELLALPGGDYDACDAQYRANCTRAARVLRRELDALTMEADAR